ncbi:MAG: ABC transporter substrate-binding protein [Actinobacteria bacterium]|nr:ABC transporter substrate-binding protein [Actinomycetota bacterium]
MSVVVLAVVVAACGSSSSGGTAGSTGASTGGSKTVSAPAGGPSGSLVYTIAIGPEGLDPDLQGLGPQGMINCSLLYDSLTYQQPNGTVEPLLATEWKTGVGKKGPYVDFKLHEGLKFEDGAPFDAETVVKRIERAKTLPGSMTLPEVASVTVTELGKYEVRMSGPNALALPAIMAGPAGMMISQKAIAEGVPLATKPEGIGMYKLVSYNSGPVIKYTANPKYWDPEAVKIKEITIQAVTDANARLNQMRTKSVDWTYLEPVQDSTAGNLGYNEVPAPVLSSYTYALNTSMKPLDDVRVRKAMAMALDREAMNEAVLAGQSKPLYQLYPELSQAFNKEVQPIPHDIPAAKKLIEEAGATGAEIELSVPSLPTKFVSLAEIAQQAWEEIGLKVSVKSAPLLQAYERFTTGKAGVGFVLAGSFADPQQGYEFYLSPKSLFNPGHFTDPKIAKLAEEGATETDAAKRLQTYRELSARTSETLSIIPVLSSVIHYWVKPEVQNFVPPITPSDPDWRSGIFVASE